MTTDEQHSEYLRGRVEEIEHRVYELVNEAIETDGNLTDQDHMLLIEEIVGVQLGRILAAKILAGGVATSDAAVARITTFARGIAASEVAKRLRSEGGSR